MELTPDLSADSFIRVLQHFIGRRGVPALLFQTMVLLLRIQKSRSLLRVEVFRGDITVPMLVGGAECSEYVLS